MDRLILDAPTLLIAARAVGLAVAARDGRLVVTGPRGAAGLARLLLERKDDILAAFTAAESSAAAAPAGPPAAEPPAARKISHEARALPGYGPPPADRSWRRIVACWPLTWRQRWGERANELQDGGEPWDAAEWIAFNELAPDLADAERRGEIGCTDPPAGLSDPEAMAAIGRAFGDPAPARRFDRGPRDVRHGDRWLPWHEAEPAEVRAKKRGKPASVTKLTRDLEKAKSSKSGR
jgi:hypothetical protein